jgi:hypothetical protein
MFHIISYMRHANLVAESHRIGSIDTCTQHVWCETEHDTPWGGDEDWERGVAGPLCGSSAAIYTAIQDYPSWFHTTQILVQKQISHNVLYSGVSCVCSRDDIQEGKKQAQMGPAVVDDSVCFGSPVTETCTCTHAPIQASTHS